VPQLILGNAAVTAFRRQYSGTSVFLSEPARDGLITEYSVTGIPQRTIGRLRETDTSRIATCIWP
jgi:hypothetical protein